MENLLKEIYKHYQFEITGIGLKEKEDFPVRRLWTTLVPWEPSFAFYLWTRIRGRERVRSNTMLVTSLRCPSQAYQLSLTLHLLSMKGPGRCLVPVLPC